MKVVDPAVLAEKYFAEAQTSVAEIGERLHVMGIIATDDKPSLAYARATKQAFDEVGFNYDLRHVQRLDLEEVIHGANDDPGIHGVFIYFPVFKNQQDDYLRNLVHYSKDIEAGSLYWTRKLYANDRSAFAGNSDKKALLPCTPLAIVKILTELGEYGEGDLPLEGKIVTIFNRSEVIGRPLAVMMSNDGALVHSFDENGPLTFDRAVASETDISRAEALIESDIVITGVPNSSFDKITAAEVGPNAICINFSSIRNFAEDVGKHVRILVPRVGPMTVAMCMRNTIRLYENFHKDKHKGKGK